MNEGHGFGTAELLRPHGASEALLLRLDEDAEDNGIENYPTEDDE